MQFFGKMKEKMAPALSDASQKLKESVDQVVAGAGEKIQENKLRSQFKALQRDKSEKLLALGTKVFTLHQGEGIGPDDLSEQLAELDTLEKQLSAKQDELDALASGAHPIEYEAAEEVSTAGSDE